MKKTLTRIIAFILFIIISLIGYLIIDATLNEFNPEPEYDLLCITEAKSALVKDTITLLSWNIGYGGLGSEMDFFYDGGRRVRPSEEYFNKCENNIMHFISDQDNIDFLLFQEVDNGSKRSYFSHQVDKIIDIMPGYCALFAANYDVKFVPVPLGRAMGRVFSGIMQLSNIQPSSAKAIYLPGSFGWPKSLFMLKRCITKSRYPHHSGNDVVIINLHNSAFDESGKIRHEELSAIKKILIEEYKKGNYVIAGGDWNSNPPDFDPSLIQNDSVFTIPNSIKKDFLPENWTYAFDPRFPTNRDVSEEYNKGKTGTTIIDFFILSPNIKLISTETKHLGFKYSDHNPVSIQISLLP